MQKINRTFKTLRRRFIHTYDNTCVTTGVVDVTIKAQIRSLRMVTVASDFLIMLNGKWSSQKFQDEQINEKFGVAFSDGNMTLLFTFHFQRCTTFSFRHV
jgi:hypothetical protein